LQHTFTERRKHDIRGRAYLLTCLYVAQEKNQRDIFTQEVTPVEIGQTVARVKLLIVSRITALTPIIYTSVYSDLIATHWVIEETGLSKNISENTKLDYQ